MLELRPDLESVEKTKLWLAQAKGKLVQAQVMALNGTAERVLREEGDQMRRSFTIREQRMLPPKYLPRAWRATPQNLTAWMNLGGKDVGSIGPQRDKYLSAFEEGIPKRGDLFRPTKALRPTKTAVIPRKMYPRNLVGKFNSLGEFQGLGATARTKIRMKKKKSDIAVYRKAVGRYFMIPGRGIYERMGSGPIGTTRKLWTYDTQVARPPILRWAATANATVNETWQRVFSSAIDQVLGTR